MSLQSEIQVIEKECNGELIKVMEIDKNTKIEYIISTFVNIMFRFNDVKVFIVKVRGEKQ